MNGQQQQAAGFLLSSSVADSALPIPNPLTVTDTFSTVVTPLSPSFTTGDGLFINGESTISGLITGLTIGGTPAPSLYLTVNRAGPNSLSLDPTTIQAQLNLATTAPQIAGGTTVPLPVSDILPSNVTSLEQAAGDLGFQQFNWVQLINEPSPSDFFANNNPNGHIIGLTNDPPPSGWTNAAGEGANPYPYYYDSTAASSVSYSLSGHVVNTNGTPDPMERRCSFKIRRLTDDFLP